MKKSFLMFLLGFSAVIYGQTENIKTSGTILDENNQPLPGVSVQLKGTCKWTTSDFDGKFAIIVDNKKVILAFSYIGYENKEIVVGNQTSINISLTPSDNALDEVVGYGTQ